LRCWIECHPDGSPDKEEEKSATHDLGEGQRKLEEGASQNLPHADAEAGDQSHLTFEKQGSKGESDAELVQTADMLSV